MQTDALAAAATTAVDVCLGVEADERCVVVTDPPRGIIQEDAAVAAGFEVRGQPLTADCRGGSEREFRAHRTGKRHNVHSGKSPR